MFLTINMADSEDDWSAGDLCETYRRSIDKDKGPYGVRQHRGHIKSPGSSPLDLSERSHLGDSITTIVILF